MHSVFIVGKHSFRQTDRFSICHIKNKEAIFNRYMFIYDFISFLSKKLLFLRFFTWDFCHIIINKVYLFSTFLSKTILILT